MTPLIGNPTAAQTSLADFRSISDLFRVNLSISRNGTETNRDVFGISTADDALDFLREDNLRARFPGYTGREAVVGTLDFRGIPIIGRYAENETQFTLEFPTINRTRVFTGLTRSQAYDAAENFFDELEDDEAEELIRELLASAARFSPIDPLAGNPNSLQAGLIERSLDLSQSGGALEDGAQQPRGRGETAPWLIGAAYSHFTSGRFDGRQLEMRGERSWRVGELSRSRVKLDVPLSIVEVQGGMQGSGSIGLAYEATVIPGRWSLEPRVAYGAVVSPDLGSAGHMGAVSLTSRYKIDNLGRGFAIIGNMIGYTTTLPLEIDGRNFGPELENIVLRNGAAYQYPLQLLIGGRAASLRGSYTHTAFSGDDLFLNQYHELGLSLGVRGREDTPRAAFELLRFSASYVFGDDYNSATVSVGYRF